MQILLACAMLLALAALGYGGLPPWPQALAVLLVTGCGLRELRRASPQDPRYVARILVTADGRFLLGLTRDPDTLLPAAVLHSWRLPGIAVGLAFADDRALRAEVILFRDRVAPDAWRYLNLRLRHPVSAGR